MTVKKKPAARPSKKVETKAPSGAPSAAARRAAEAQVKAIVAKFAPEQLRLVASARKALRKRLPTAIEVVYEYLDCCVISYSPSERGYEGVLGIRASADGVKLFFNRGNELPDPSKLLRGSGKQTRAIELEKAATLSLPEVVRLIDEAIARNPAPFASAGRGAVIFRSKSAK